ncbi:Uncharacterized protein Fot_35705 [Forsythia ovata]|uniref:Uncharacterized protein n=1 Tax=Forsythia ovata TaxID=205694 RepID=A0ABD1SMB3_9LAMI
MLAYQLNKRSLQKQNQKCLKIWKKKWNRYKIVGIFCTKQSKKNWNKNQSLFSTQKSHPLDVAGVRDLLCNFDSHQEPSINLNKHPMKDVKTLKGTRKESLPTTAAD